MHNTISTFLQRIARIIIHILWEHINFRKTTAGIKKSFHFPFISVSHDVTENK